MAIVLAGVLAPETADAQDDCVDLMGCQWCVNATETEAHKFSTAGANSCNNDEINPYHTDWVYNAGCSSHHGNCDIARFADHSVQIKSLIASADVAALATYAISYPGQVTVNFERAAVQLHGCRGQTIAHLPLSADVMRGVTVALRAELTRLPRSGSPTRMAPTPAGSFVEYLTAVALK